MGVGCVFNRFRSIVCVDKDVNKNLCAQKYAIRHAHKMIMTIMLGARELKLLGYAICEHEHELPSLTAAGILNNIFLHFLTFS